MPLPRCLASIRDTKTRVPLSARDLYHVALCRRCRCADSGRPANRDSSRPRFLPSTSMRIRRGRLRNSSSASVSQPAVGDIAAVRSGRRIPRKSTFRTKQQRDRRPNSRVRREQGLPASRQKARYSRRALSLGLCTLGTLMSLMPFISAYSEAPSSGYVVPMQYTALPLSLKSMVTALRTSGTFATRLNSSVGGIEILDVADAVVVLHAVFAGDERNAVRIRIGQEAPGLRARAGRACSSPSGLSGSSPDRTSRSCRGPP